MLAWIQFIRGHFSKNQLTTFGLLLLVITASLDYITGYEVRFTVMYLIAVFILTIAVDGRLRILVALFTAFIAFVMDLINKPILMTTGIFIWNKAMMLVMYIALPQLLSAYIDAMEKQSDLSQKDLLTGLFNRDAFYHLAEMERQKSLRYDHVFSIAYIDCDNFKVVNDTLGHAAGDALLISVADILKANLRVTDIIARLGGDEFVILFPETDQVACEVVRKIEEALLLKMKQILWPVTFSIGIATFTAPPQKLDDVIVKADGLMYYIKHHGKNGIKCEIY